MHPGLFNYDETRGADARSSWRNLRRYARVYRPYPGRLALGLLASLGYALALLPIPLLFKRIIDMRIPAGDVSGMLLDSTLVLGLYVVYLGLSVAGRYFILWVTKQVILRLRADAVEKLQRLSISFYDRQDLGRLHARVIQDTEKVDVMSNFIVSVVLVSFVTAIGTLAVMFWLNWTLSLVVLATLVLFGAVIVLFRDRAKEQYRLWRVSFDTFSSQVQELIHSIRLVRAFGTQERENARVNETNSALTDRGIRMVTFFTFYSGVMELLMGVAQVLVIFGGGWLAISGQLSVGALVAYYSLLWHLFNPVRAILVNMEQAYAGIVALDSLYDLLDHPEVEPNRNVGIAGTIDGIVEFDRVSFAYDSERPVLRETSVVCEPGHTVALVGHSGAGKTTFINLLLGFYRPQSGCVKIDGVDLGEYRSQSLRSQMAVVSQDNVVLSGTVRSNILYGRPDATPEQVESAARQARAHDFIVRLADGYDSEVGDRGVKLSGGQKQRIAIARAILRNPRILILDEATSALDTESESLVQEALENLQNQRTTFVIAHRLSTVRNADEILVFEDGRVIERGTHVSLLAADGVYARHLGAQSAV